MDISVIFATYKRPRLLEATLNSFLSLKWGGLAWEIVLVDNAGDAETENIVRNYADVLPIRLLVVTKRGKNNALNRAVAEAQGKLFVFTDDDVVVESDWLVEMWKGANRWGQNHVFGGRILPKFPEGHVQPFDHPFLRGAYAIADFDIPEGVYEAHRVWGPNMAIRGALFREGWKFSADIGPDGSATYVPGSETDLTNRLENAGYAAVYLPRSVVHHQIRREQLESDWLYGRAFRFGQSNARREDKSNMSLFLGVPLYLMKKLLIAYIRIALSLFSSDEKRNFSRRIFFWDTKGRIHWYRKVYAKMKS